MLLLPLLITELCLTKRVSMTSEAADCVMCVPKGPSPCTGLKRREACGYLQDGQSHPFHDE